MARAVCCPRAMGWSGLH